MEYANVAREIIDRIENEEGENISKAAQLVADAIMNGGILQAFGSGHSRSAAIEICGRAGGLIPSKAIFDGSDGEFERIEGVGTLLMNKVDLRENDVLVVISNSGRNPMGIEVADYAKSVGASVIVVTALEVSKSSSSRHSSGKLLYEFADVVLDNKSNFGDATLDVEGLDTKVCGTSSVAAVVLLQQMIYEAVQIMVDKGFEPPIYKSANIDGGPEYNYEIEKKYSDRIWHK